MPCCSSAPLFAWYDVGDFWKWGNLNDGGDSSAVRNQLMKTSPAPPTWRCHLYDPRNTFPQCSAPNFFLLPLLEVSPALFSSEVPKNKKNWKNKSKKIQEEHGQHTGTTFIKTVKRIAGGGAAPSLRASHPPFFRHFPCCLDNDTKQAEPQPQPLSQQQQETCRGIVLTFAPLRNNNTNKKKKKAQNDKKKQEETRRR